MTEPLLLCLDLSLYWTQQHIHYHTQAQSKEDNFGAISDAVAATACQT